MIEELIGTVIVDSGSIIISDPTYHYDPDVHVNIIAGLGDGEYKVYGKKYRDTWLEIRIELCTIEEVDEAYEETE